MTTTLVINHQHIVLRDDLNVDALLADLLDGVHAGGAVVHFPGTGGREYDVIVTPSTQAIVVYCASTTDDRDADDPWLTGIDLDC